MAKKGCIFKQYNLKKKKKQQQHNCKYCGISNMWVWTIPGALNG